MTSILFLGNSHLSAIKLAYDDIGNQFLPKSSFYCARGADLAFTEVANGKIKPLTTTGLDEEELEFFFPADIRYYIENKRPLGGADVAQQFIFTGGTAEIDISDVDAVFYVAGISPYDFRRLRDGLRPISGVLWGMLLQRMLQERFLLRHQIRAIKEYRPQSKHFFIGVPLAASGDLSSVTAMEKEVIRINRNIIGSLSKNFLFDDVFMPPEDLLDETLLHTKDEYRTGGREESENFQGEEASRSDLEHMNRSYGKKVFDKFIIPLLDSLSRDQEKRISLKTRFGTYLRKMSQAK